MAWRGHMVHERGMTTWGGTFRVRGRTPAHGASCGEAAVFICDSRGGARGCRRLGQAVGKWERTDGTGMQVPGGAHMWGAAGYYVRAVATTCYRRACDMSLTVCDAPFVRSLARSLWRRHRATG